MVDFDLHMRFWRCTADAFFQLGQASMAAALAVQEKALEPPPAEPGVTGLPAGVPNPLLMMSWCLGQSGPAPVQNFFAHTEHAQAAAPVTAWGALFSPYSAGETSNSTAALWANPWAMFGLTTPWPSQQSPMISYLVSNGVPGAVAVPAARASTSALDAAEAAQEQWRRLVSACQV